MLRLADTAGIRTGNLDTVETIGIEKSEKMLAECELLFAIFDISRPFDSEDEALIDKIKKANCVKIAILNKNDAPCRFDATELDGIFTSVLVGSARHSDRLIEEITESVEKAFLDGEIKLGESAVVSTARQNASLRRASELLDLAIDSLEAGFAQDAVAGDLERALSAVSELDGRAVSEEVVADIFAKFCVGK
jgi:tRNA modification GTPase